MKAIAIVAFAIALGGHAQTQQNRENEIPPLSEEPKIEARFTAKIEWVEMKGKREASVVPIGVDPHWLVAVEILSVEMAEKPFDTKRKLVLLIHSSALLFAGEEKPSGKTYMFKVFGTMSDGRPAFHHAEADKIESPAKK